MAHKFDEMNIRIQEARERHDTRENRRVDAAIRSSERNERSDYEQLNLLDQRLGFGVGAKKERSRLLIRITGTGVMR